MNMDRNIEYYNQNAQSFYESTVEADMSFWRDKFIALLPNGGRVLDAGCGSGRDSKAFIQSGFSVVAFDASKELCRLASELIDQEVWQMKFQEISFDEEFDGVWACASLLHVSSDEIEDATKKLESNTESDETVLDEDRIIVGSNESTSLKVISISTKEIIPIKK